LSDEDGRKGGEWVATALTAMAAMLADAEDELGRIDAVAGDGDHGRGMVKGSSAARAAADAAVKDGAGQGSVLTAAGKAWAAKAGGTSGVLWGALLSALGARLGDTGKPDSATVAAGVRDGYDALVSLGGASPGDKTMLDALLPFTEELERRTADGESWQHAWGSAAGIATDAAKATADMRPKVGRARPLAERSVGTPDAGATSLAMCAHTVADSFTLSAKGDG
jgi:dihydroxyacetone kinase